jgi:hypothetical protein
LKLKLFLCWLVAAGCLFAQQAMNDQRILELAGLGVANAEIQRLINAAPTVDFYLTPSATDQLMKAGVSAETIKLMAARQNGGVAEVKRSFAQTTSETRETPNVQQPAVAPERLQVLDIGVYYRTAPGPWTQLLPEVVNWKTGGVLKTAVTAGIVRGDLNGRINGGASKTRLASNVEILVKCPEGTEITEYQLLKLRRHSNSREFRTVTGGILHVSGGSNRDLLPFDPKNMAHRSYTISLSALGDGQFGILPPGSYQSHSASAQLGKMYTFSISE